MALLILLLFSWTGPAAVVTVILGAIGILGGLIGGSVKLWKLSVAGANRWRALAALAEKELTPNSGSSMKDSVTSAARDAADALSIAKETQSDLGVLKDQFAAFTVAQTTDQQSQWAQIRKIGNA